MEKGANRQKILLIDDTPMILRILLDILTEDYDTLIAKSGEEGLKLVKKLKPDMILMDVMMPGMSGYDVIKALKADKETESIPIILITGSDTGVDEAYGYSIGAVDYIIKPFVDSVVKHKVDFVMEFVSMKRRLEQMQ